MHNRQKIFSFKNFKSYSLKLFFNLRLYYEEGRDWEPDIEPYEMRPFSIKVIFFFIEIQ